MVGGPFVPYVQSERTERYSEVAELLRASGKAYDCYCSQTELDKRREQAREEGRSSGYDGHCRALTPEQTEGYLAEGRRPVLRMRMPDRLIVFDVPPVLAGADTLALSAYMDATILLVEECKTRKEDIARSCELLANSNLVGIVLNKSRELPEAEPITRPRPGFLRRFFGAEG